MGKVEATAVPIVFVGGQKNERSPQCFTPSRQPFDLSDAGFFPDDDHSSAFHCQRQVLTRRTAQTSQVSAFAGSLLDVLVSDLFWIGVIARWQIDIRVVNVLHQGSRHVLGPLKAGLKHGSCSDVC